MTFLTPFVASTLLFAPAAQAQAHGPEDAWALVHIKAGDVAIHPRTGEQRPLPDPDPAGLRSPDGARVLFQGTPPGSRSIDLFVADIAPDEPSHKRNIVRLTTGLTGIHDVSWTPDGHHALFLADHSAGSQVFLVSTHTPDGAQVQAEKPRMISDTSGPCLFPDASSDGRLAWGIVRERRGKGLVCDLVVATMDAPGELAPARQVEAAPERPQTDGPSQKGLIQGPRQVLVQQPAERPALPAPPIPPSPLAPPVPPITPITDPDVIAAPLRTTPLVKGIHLLSLAFSPNGALLAYSEPGFLRIHDSAAGDTKSFKFTDINKDLYAHGGYHLAWRADGKVVAATVRFLGGRMVEPGGDPDFIAGDKELYFFPLAGNPWSVTAPPHVYGVEWVAAPQ